MTQSEKLEALVQRAIEGGFKGPIPSFALDHPPVQYTFIRSEGLIEVLTPAQRWLFGIFNLDFARALFGEEDTCVTCGQSREHTERWCDFPDYIPAFQYHLQHAVISKDPVDYMYEVAFGDE